MPSYPSNTFLHLLISTNINSFKNERYSGWHGSAEFNVTPPLNWIWYFGVHEVERFRSERPKSGPICIRRPSTKWDNIQWLSAALTIQADVRRKSGWHGRVRLLFAATHRELQCRKNAVLSEVLREIFAVYAKLVNSRLVPISRKTPTDVR